MSSFPTRSAGFDRLAATYDRLRPTDDRWLATVAQMVELGDLRARRVLDVGCGTGRLGIALARDYGADVTGLDSSSEMLAVARDKEPSITWTEGRAEELPFRDASFERAVMSLVVHHLERATAFPEVRRVLVGDGRFVISTPNPDGFERHWLASLFPSFVPNERARFPTADELAAELRAAGFADVTTDPFEIPRSFSREFALERLSGRYGSMFDLLSDEEYLSGLNRADRELSDPVEYIDLWLLLVARGSS
jgi:SAM-dependent methyltransferase